MTGRCPECGHDPSSDALERRCEQLEEENVRLRGALLGLYDCAAVRIALAYPRHGIGTATPTGQAILAAKRALESKPAD